MVEKTFAIWNFKICIEIVLDQDLNLRSTALDVTTITLPMWLSTLCIVRSK
jgi:hypothetical protein